MTLAQQFLIISVRMAIWASHEITMDDNKKQQQVVGQRTTTIGPRNDYKGALALDSDRLMICSANAPLPQRRKIKLRRITDSTLSHSNSPSRALLSLRLRSVRLGDHFACHLLPYLNGDCPGLLVVHNYASERPYESLLAAPALRRALEHIVLRCCVLCGEPGEFLNRATIWNEQRHHKLFRSVE